KGDIDRELLVRAFLAARIAEPLSALAAGAAGEAPEFEQIHRDALNAVEQMNRAPGLRNIVAERIELRVVEGVDEWRGQKHPTVSSMTPVPFGPKARRAYAQKTRRLNLRLVRLNGGEVSMTWIFARGVSLVRSPK